MKNILILFFIILVSSCSLVEEPNPLVAQATINQRASRSSIWKAALVTYGSDINAVELVTKRGFYEKYESIIDPNQPFAMILETFDWNGTLNVQMDISNKNQRLITVSDSIPIREVYIHPNGNLNAAIQMAESITFPCEILILE